MYPNTRSPNGIECRPDVMFGKPVVAGTRITVESLVERLAAGETPEEILQAHPRLTKDGFQAALAYVAAVLKSDILHSMAD